MSQAPTYTRATGFANDERDNVGGRATVRTAQVDAELDAISTSINALVANVALNQRDDGEIRDGRVKIPALASEVLALLISYGATPRGAWLTGTSYSLKDLVTQSTNTYMATTPHVGGTFATDLAAGKWILLALGTSPTASAIPFTPTATISASTIQGAIEESDTENRATAAANLATALAAVSSLTADLADNINAAKGPGQIGYSEVPAYAAGTLGRIVQRIQAPTTAGWDTATFGPHNAVYGPGAGAGLEGAYSGGAPGDYNTFFGNDAGKDASTMTTSSGFGYRALYSMRGGEYNFAFGYNILSALTSGNNNTAVGSGLRDLVTGSDNVSVGFGAGLLLAAGSENTLVGANAYRIGASGEKNTVIGSQAAYALSGNDNVVIGQAALTAATTGGSNAVAGSLSGRVVTGVSFSSFWGAQTAYNKASGNECSYFGFQAGMNDATDFGCTAIGTTAGPDTSAFHSKSTAIGYGARYTGSNQLILGGTGSNAVNVGIGTDTPINRLHTVGTAAGTAALRLDSTATTGVQSATWSAPSNKPGAASGTVAKWIPVSLDGTTYYIPAWT